MSFANIVIAVLIFFLFIFLALIIIGSRKVKQPATPTPTPAASTTPAVPILKRIPWTAVGIVVAIIILIAGMIYIGDKIGKSNEERKEINAFKIESLSGVTIINQGSNSLIAKGEKLGASMTLISEERNPPCVYFNFSGGNSTFEVSIDGVYYGDDKNGGVYLFSRPVGFFNTCHHRAKMGDNEKKIIKVEIVAEPGDTIRIWNYRTWEEY